MSPRTNVCASCGLRWKPGHQCPTSIRPSRILAVAFLSFSAALTATFAVTQTGMSWYSIAGACALFATFWLPVAQGRTS